MLKCSCCDKSSESHKTVNCLICAKPYKIECANISAAEARKIHSKTGYSWTCKHCLQFGNDLASLRTVISALQVEVKALKDSIREPPPVTKTSLIETEKIIHEISEREKRKNNIVVFGYKEATSSSRNEQSKLDNELVDEICLDLGITDANIKTFRLGKYDPTQSERKRPIKVAFSSESSVITVMRNLAKLKDNPRFTNMFIFRDRTPMQIQLHNEVKAELSARLNNGEADIKIKYIKGIPSIVSTLN